MEAIRFRTEDGLSLEGELRMPDAPSRGSAVLCHAHPRRGGSKDHPILWAIRNELAAAGFAVLSLNFRGTMRSAGTYGGGRTEVRDVAAAVGRIRDEAEGPTVVCGWSFGANVALREAVVDERVAALALIGPPISQAETGLPELPSASELRAFRRPTLLVAGEGDDHCRRPDLEALGRRLPRARVEIIAGTDHFFWRRERGLAGLIGEFAREIAEAG